MSFVKIAQNKTSNLFEIINKIIVFEQSLLPDKKIAKISSSFVKKIMHNINLEIIIFYKYIIYLDRICAYFTRE